jgi:hypothetical protein
MTTSTIQLPAGFVEGILNDINLLLVSFQSYIWLIITIVAIGVIIEIFVSGLKK